MSAPTIPAEKLSREEINRKQKEYIFPSVTTYFSDPVPMDHASMQHVWDVEGKKYLDFFGGIVTISVGHCNPRVTSWTKAQIERMQHVSTCFPNEPTPKMSNPPTSPASRTSTILPVDSSSKPDSPSINTTCGSRPTAPTHTSSRPP
ncbi:MAG: aminotransferase class III-fold pyridoxal phosphate-dependent enzyme, partial [Acidobacteriia bacterium]|nr:aminotransferase class III-fold pyridoxal phosphate-dependent enzyme [Terriglobia bacterium]